MSRQFRLLSTLGTLSSKMAESAAKRLKTTDSSSEGAGMTIGTHNGHFHADEALAVHMLRTHVPAYAGAGLVRTRDPARLETCHTVVDVGGEYDPPRRRFDHHQRSFTTTFPGRPTKLSSAGLVFMHFGQEIVRRRLLSSSSAVAEQEKEKRDEEVATTTIVDTVWRKLYESFIEALDAHDNGVAAYDPAAVRAAGLEKRFSDGGFTLGAVVGRFNPSWNDPVPTDRDEAQRREDERFLAASRRIGEEFDRELDYLAGAWLPARAVVKTAFAARARHDPAGRIMVLEGQSAPWKDHLYTLEEEEGQGEGAQEKVLYVLYPEKPVPDAKWRVQCVPVAHDSFESRKPLPEAWRGARDAELDGIAGIPGCVFVHASGFIGGNATFDGALAMARRALEI